jgi:hypothetical protein
MSAVDEAKVDDVGGVIDINDPRLAEVVDKFDPNADASLRVVPPDGEYEVRLKLGEKGVYGKRTEKSGFYLVAETYAYIVAPDNPKIDGYRLGPDYHNSIVNQRVATSSLADLMRILGKPFMEGMNLQTMGNHAKTVLEEEPHAVAKTEWQSYSKDVQEAFEKGDTVNGKKTGIFKKGERNYPEIKDGETVIGHDYVLECPITGAEIPARPKILQYQPLPPKEATEAE